MGWGAVGWVGFGVVVVWFLFWGFLLFSNVLSVIVYFWFCHREDKWRLLQVVWNSVHTFVAEVKSSKDWKYFFLEITFMRNRDHVGY